MEITRDSDRVQFAQIADWGADSSPENTPEGYGVEFEINLYNDKSTGITQPFCELEYWNQFAANWYSVTPPDWMIVASGDTVASELQPYWDTNGLDECSRMTFAVGVRYPQLIEPDEDGHFAYVFWSATETEEDVDRLAASLQLVDDEECVARENSYPPWADIDLPWCMGFRQIAPPAGSNNPRMVLNHDRFIYGPDFCWTSANFGGSGGYVPRTYCGPGINWDAVPMTAVSPKSGSQSNGWDVTITHQSDDLDWSVYPYSSALPAISPNQPADWKNIGQIADVRAWIDGSPVDVSFEGWEFEEALPVNNRFTLSNEAMKVGDGSAMTMAKFFRNGALSFRKGFNADVNWIRLNQLHEMWNPEAFDPFNCVIGSNHEGDDETQRNRVVVGYGLEEQCTFSAAGELNSTAAFGIATHTESSPGYLFHGDLEDGWIPREEHSVWRPSNGSAVVVSYMDTITSTQVPFYSGVQNSESTYVGNTSIPLPGYDSDLPTVEIEVSSQLFTDTSSWDCRWVLEETPACESYRTDFDLNAMHMWPPITQGAGWRELADSGGTIAFTTSQGTPVVLTLLPGSYYSNDLSMPPGPSRPGR